MRLIEAPERWDGDAPSVFLAGGITGCPDWQTEAIDRLRDTSLVLLNPRRQDFPIDDPAAAVRQITWEHDHLRRATAILFWFPRETLCPIVLYELGAWSMTTKPLFVGAHPHYQRRPDVIIQTRLARPDVLVLDSLAVLTAQAAVWSMRMAEEASTCSHS